MYISTLEVAFEMTRVRARTVIVCLWETERVGERGKSGPFFKHFKGERSLFFRSIFFQLLHLLIFAVVTLQSLESCRWY